MDGGGDLTGGCVRCTRAIWRVAGDSIGALLQGGSDSLCLSFGVHLNNTTPCCATSKPAGQPQRATGRPGTRENGIRHGVVHANPFSLSRGVARTCTGTRPGGVGSVYRYIGCSRIARSSGRVPPAARIAHFSRAQAG